MILNIFYTKNSLKGSHLLQFIIIIVNFTKMNQLNSFQLDLHPRDDKIMLDNYLKNYLKKIERRISNILGSFTYG